MKWILDLVWDTDLSVTDNLALWSLAVVGFTLFYGFLIAVLLLGEHP